MGETSDGVATFERIERRNKRAWIAGAIATAFATGVFLLLSEFVPQEELRMAIWKSTGQWMFGNPLGQLPFLGGFVGGFVAGYLAVDHNERPNWMASVKYGLISGAAGAALLYLGWIAVLIAQNLPGILANLDKAIFIVGDLLIFPLVFMLPLAPILMFEGMIAGGLGYGANLVLPDGIVQRA